MNIEITKTDTYLLTDIDGLDPVTVYVRNYAPERGKIVIECFGKAWSYYWGGMGDRTLQEFFISCDNPYILGKLLKDTTETDFEKINNKLNWKGINVHVENDVEVAMHTLEMEECFGPDWYFDIPQCKTADYEYLGRIIDVVKTAFRWG